MAAAASSPLPPRSGVERPITAYESITSMLRQLGYKPQTRIVSVASSRPTRRPPGRCAAASARRWSLWSGCASRGPTPLVYCVEIVRRDSLPDELEAEAFKGSLNDLLEQMRKRPACPAPRSRRWNCPSPSPGSSARKHAGPWLLITETCFTDRGEPVVFARDYHRGDAFSFNFSRR